MTSVYVAGGSSEADLCAGYIQRLREANVEITFDWPALLRVEGEANPRDASCEERARRARQCLAGAFAADILWLVVPAAPSVGAWFEMGAAHAVSQEIIVSGDHLCTIFTALADHCFAEHEQAFQWIIDRADRRVPRR